MQNGKRRIDMASNMEYVLEIHRPGPRHQPVDGIMAYVVRTPDGDAHSVDLDWDELMPLLTALEASTATPEDAQRLGDVLRASITSAAWSLPEAALLAPSSAPATLPAPASTSASGIKHKGAHHHIIIRSSAAEIYALPWELMTLTSTGQHLWELPHVHVSMAWPTVSKPHWRRRSRDGCAGRVLMAWSAAGGGVPAADHIEAVAQAAGDRAFNPGRDVLAHVSAENLREELGDSTKPPVAVLHLLCHGAAVDDTFGLVLAQPSIADDASSSSVIGQAKIVDAGWVRRVVGPHAGHIRVALLCACHSGNPGQAGNHLGSVAQVLHRAGIEHVIASRYPLASESSVRFARAFYRRLFAHGNTAELPVATAFADARRELGAIPGVLDWAALQLYSASGAAVRRSWRKWITAAVAAMAAMATIAAITIAVPAIGAIFGNKAPAFKPWAPFHDRGGLVVLRERQASPALVDAWADLCARTGSNQAMVRCHQVPPWDQVEADIRSHALSSNTSVIARFSEQHQEPFVHIIAVQGPNGASWWRQLDGLRLAAHGGQPAQDRNTLAQTLMGLASHMGQQPNRSQQGVSVPATAHAYTPEVTILMSWIRSARSVPATAEERQYVRNHVERCRKSSPPLALWHCALAHYLRYGVHCTGQVACGAEDVDEELRQLAHAWRQSTIGRAASAVLIQRTIRGGHTDAAFAELAFWDSLPAANCFRLTMMELANDMPVITVADQGNNNNNNDEATRQRLACPVTDRTSDGAATQPPHICPAKHLRRRFATCDSERIANALLFRGKAFARQRQFDDAAAQLRHAIDIPLSSDSPVTPVLLLWWAESELHRSSAIADATRKEIFERLEPFIIAEPAAVANMAIRTHTAYVAWLASLTTAIEEDAAQDLLQVYMDEHYAPMEEDPSVAELAHRAGPRAQTLYQGVLTQRKNPRRLQVLRDGLSGAIAHPN